VFPDPFNCSQSHFCSEGGSSSVLSECPRGRIFDSKLKLCVHISPLNINNRRICQKINCNRVTNNFILYPTNPAFYAYCFVSATGVRQTYMYKCDDDTNKIFDLKTNTCRFNCKSIGYFADPSDCSSYYICNGLKFASRHVHCPPNYYFNGTVCLNSKAHCAPGSIPSMTTTTSEKTTMMTNELTMTESIVDSTSESMINSVSPSITDSDSESMTDSASQSITDSSSHSIIDSTSQSMTDSSSQSMIDSTSQSMIDATSQSMIDTTSQSMTDLASQSMHDQATDQSMPSATNLPPSSDTMDILPIGSQISTTTKKPITIPCRTSGIWKHMGRFSVRVGRCLNFV